MKVPVLILAIDRDNDLYEKAGISGPVVGRKKCLHAATELALADPEDPDSNAIFYAIKLLDEMKKGGEEVEVAIITGNKKLGYEADREIGRQLDKIIQQTGALSCIVISDGASDDEVLPVIQSRIKIDAVKNIYIKQAKELEKTYFVILEKLKDPYYAKILVGLPAAIILLFSLASILGMGWQPVGIIIGTYLILKGFGLDEAIYSFFKGFRFSFGKPSWVPYLASFGLIMISLVVAFQSYNDGMDLGLNGEKLVAYIIRNIVYLLMFTVLLMIIGQILDAWHEGRKYRITTHSLSAIGIILGGLILKIGSDWVLNLNPPYVSFGDLLITIIISAGVGYLSSELIKMMRTDLILKMKLEEKEVIEESGGYLGKVIGVDPKNMRLVVETIFEKKIWIPFNHIESIGENIIIKKY